MVFRWPNIITTTIITITGAVTIIITTTTTIITVTGMVIEKGWRAGQGGSTEPPFPLMRECGVAFMPRAY